MNYDLCTPKLSPLIHPLKSIRLDLELLSIFHLNQSQTWKNPLLYKLVNYSSVFEWD